MELRAFLLIFVYYEIYASSCWLEMGRCCNAVVFEKGMYLDIRLVFLGTEDKLVVLGRVTVEPSDMWLFTHRKVWDSRNISGF